jgi:RHS repeat-associated protein
MPPGNFSDPHNHYSFTGQELDENVGVYDFFARNYDHSTGTWLTQDTYRGQIRDPQSLHRLGYVEGNPTSYTDAYGFCPFCIVALAVGGGALINVASRYVGDVITNVSEGKSGWDVVKPSSTLAQYTVSAVSGGIGGGLSLINPILGGTVSGFLESTFEDVVEGKPVSPGKIIFDTLISAGTAGIGDNVIKAIFPTKIRGKVAQKALNYILSKRSIRELKKLLIDAGVSIDSAMLKKIYEMLGADYPDECDYSAPRIPDAILSPSEPGYTDPFANYG